MKKILIFIIVIIPLVFTFIACNGVSPTENYTLTKDMTAEDIFEMIKKANSFSVSVGTNEYRFLKNKGYTIYEDKVDGISSVKDYEAFFVEEGKLYSIKNDIGTSINVKCLVPTNEDYEKIYDTYFNYVEYVKSSYATTKDGIEISVEISENTANVKTIYRQGQGYLEVKECKVFDINCSELYIPKAYSNYKELIKDETLS